LFNPCLFLFFVVDHPCVFGVDFIIYASLCIFITIVSIVLPFFSSFLTLAIFFFFFFFFFFFCVPPVTYLSALPFHAPFSFLASHKPAEPSTEVTVVLYCLSSIFPVPLRIWTPVVESYFSSPAHSFPFLLSPPPFLDIILFDFIVGICSIGADPPPVFWIFYAALIRLPPFCPFPLLDISWSRFPFYSSAFFSDVFAS